MKDLVKGFIGFYGKFFNLHGKGKKIQFKLQQQRKTISSTELWQTWATAKAYIDSK